MSQADNEIGAIIVRNIDLLENAVTYGATKMDRILGREIGSLIGQKRDEAGWNGSDNKNLSKDMWLAPADWISKPGDEDVYDLHVCLDFTGENYMWAGTLLGVSGSTAFLTVGSNTLTDAQLKKLLIVNLDLAEDFTAQGFLWDPKGSLTLPFETNREALATAFSEEDFSEALAPLAAALDHAIHSRQVLDRLAALIRGQIAKL